LIIQRVTNSRFVEITPFLTRENHSSTVDNLLYSLYIRFYIEFIFQISGEEKMVRNLFMVVTISCCLINPAFSGPNRDVVNSVDPGHIPHLKKIIKDSNSSPKEIEKAANRLVSIEKSTKSLKAKLDLSKKTDLVKKIGHIEKDLAGINWNSLNKIISSKSAPALAKPKPTNFKALPFIPQKELDALIKKAEPTIKRNPDGTFVVKDVNEKIQNIMNTVKSLGYDEVNAGPALMTYFRDKQASLQK